eukprot:469884-Lingulodinium_polyedra.AAC.1
MLETSWGLRGGPRCPLIAAESSAVAAHLAGRSCGLGPIMARTQKFAGNSLPSRLPLPGMAI